MRRYVFGIVVIAIALLGCGEGAATAQVVTPTVTPTATLSPDLVLATAYCNLGTQPHGQLTILANGKPTTVASFHEQHEAQATFPYPLVTFDPTANPATETNGLLAALYDPTANDLSNSAEQDFPLMPFQGTTSVHYSFSFPLNDLGLGPQAATPGIYCLELIGTGLLPDGQRTEEDAHAVLTLHK